jgi:hypothetical protein
MGADLSPPKDYNECRPHMGLGNLTPTEYLLKAESCSEESCSETMSVIVASFVDHEI